MWQGKAPPLSGDSPFGRNLNLCVCYTTYVDRRIVCDVNFLLEFQMYQIQQRIAVLTKSRAKLLAELQELDRLREQVRNAGQSGACASE